MDFFLRQDSKGGFSITGSSYTIALVVQVLHEDLPKPIVVVGDQNRGMLRQCHRRSCLPLLSGKLYHLSHGSMPFSLDYSLHIDLPTSSPCIRVHRDETSPTQTNKQ